jgi:hypothetical protein
LLLLPACLLDPYGGEDGSDPSGPHPHVDPMVSCSQRCNGVVATGSPVAYKVQVVEAGEAYTVTATCSGVPCTATVADPGKPVVETTVTVAGLGDGELSVVIALVDAHGGLLAYDMDPVEIRTVTGIGFSCVVGTANGPPCPTPVPAGSDVFVTAQDDSAKGPFYDPDLALTVTSSTPNACMSDACQMLQVAAGTIELEAIEHDVTADDTISVQ